MRCSLDRKSSCTCHFIATFSFIDFTADLSLSLTPNFLSLGAGVPPLPPLAMSLIRAFIYWEPTIRDVTSIHFWSGVRGILSENFAFSNSS